MPPQTLFGRSLARVNASALWAWRRTPWWFAVFVVALTVRVAYILIVDPPLGSPTSTQLIWVAIDLAGRPSFWREIRSGEYWREWNGWTVAPLYPLFLTTLVKIAGARLLVIRLVQAALGALSAVGVAALGRAVGGPRGVSAGFAMALYAPFITLPSEALSECLHTPLLVMALAGLAHAVNEQRVGRSAASATLGGVLFALSALTRAVSLAFLPIAAAWMIFERGWRRGAKLAGLFVGAAFLVILPWLARNFVLYGRYVPIETVSVYNLWRDNPASDPGHQEIQTSQVIRCKHTACSSTQALVHAVENAVHAPGAFVGKVREHSRHLWRPEAVRMWLVAELPGPWWSHAERMVLEDGIFLTAQALFLAFLLAPPRRPAHRLLVLWTFYYVFLLTFVFHSEIRYRSALIPLLIAGAWGGWAAVGRHPFRCLNRRHWIALAVGSLWAATHLLPYVPTAAHVVASAPELWRAHAAVVQGRFADAERAVAVAAERDPGAARPWRWYGGWLARAGQPLRAAQAYARGAKEPAGGWMALLVPSLLRDAGGPAAAGPATVAGLSLDQGGDRDLDAAWKELPPLRADCVTIGQADFGMARGFSERDQDGRWTGRRAWLRIVPRQIADEQRVTLWMDSGPPSPLAQPEVAIRIGRDEPRVFRLTRGPAPYEMRTRVIPGAPVIVKIESPTWTTVDAAPEQGVRVRRVCVEPVQTRSE